MSTTNRELEAIFASMAMLTELLGGDKFRVNAFAKASRLLGELTTDLRPLPPEEIAQLPGIGKGTAQRITQYLTTGRIDEHEALAAQVPAGVVGLMSVPGLGPKKARLLWQEAGVTSREELQEKLKDDALAALPGMGKKTLENLRKSLAFVATASQRVRIDQAMALAHGLMEPLGPDVRFAGSLRRGRDTIGDIDLITPSDLHERFVTLPQVEQVLAQGETKSSVRVKGGVQVDLRSVDPACLGAALLYFTGSKAFNVMMRQRAIERGLSLNEYGLWRGEACVARATEDEIFTALGLPFIPPELREERWGLTPPPARLIEMRDIRAELHAHTTASDGVWSIQQYARAAAARGFHTVAVTDHSRSQPQANGLSIDRLVAHIEAIRAAAAALKGVIRVLAGSEVDILADGSLDYPDELLAELDVVVASPHAALTQEPERATARLLRAMENRYVTILGHPTGRLINRREGLSPDMEALFRLAAQRGIALEINANPYRLDLRDTHALAALRAGCYLAINTDAHGEGDLDLLPYGLITARRAGATPDRVVNTFTPEQLDAWLAHTRR